RRPPAGRRAAANIPVRARPRRRVRWGRGGAGRGRGPPPLTARIPGVGADSGIGKNGDMEEVQAGRLLVATPLLGDPNFKRTVVLVVEDEPEEGALGVVLNRPTKGRVGRVLEPWTDLVSDPSVVFRGGPVAPNSALGLASVPGQEEPVGWRALHPSALPSRVGLIDLDTPPQLVA